RRDPAARRLGHRTRATRAGGGVSVLDRAAVDAAALLGARAAAGASLRRRRSAYAAGRTWPTGHRATGADLQCRARGAVSRPGSGRPVRLALRALCGGAGGCSGGLGLAPMARAVADTRRCDVSLLAAVPGAAVRGRSSRGGG